MSGQNTKQSIKNKYQQRIRIRLKSFEHKVIDIASKKIVETAESTGATVSGPIPLPRRKKVWCVLKSPHVDKRGGEHYELRVHKRLIEIIEPPSTTIDALMGIDLATGVDIEIKLM